MAGRTAQFDAIGTKWNIHLSDALSDAAWTELLGRVEARIDAFDKTYSRFRDDSLVAQISRQAGTYELPPDAYKLLKFYEQLYRATDGRVTPLIGQTMVEAGYDANYSFHKGELHAPKSWEEALDYDERHLKTTQPVLLDFGAAGKGYLIDLVAEIFHEAGHKTYVIDAGGDIVQRTATGEPTPVGLENPLDHSEAIGIVQLTNKSLCASSGSKRTWSGIHHIIDPIALRSPRDVTASWVLADNTMTADGLATALFFMPAERLKKQFTFSYAVLNTTMELQYDHAFPVELFKEP